MAKNYDLIASVNLAGQWEVDITSIPQTYKTLVFVGAFKFNTSSKLLIRTTSSASVWAWTNFEGRNSSLYAPTANFSTSYAYLPGHYDIPQSETCFEIVIPNYTSARGHTLLGKFGDWQIGSLGYIGANWNQNAAITGIKFQTNTGSFSFGQIKVYGLV